MFFVCFKKFDQVARRCLAWLYTPLVGLPGSEHGWAACGSSRRWSGSWALLLKAIARFQSNGNVPGLWNRASPTSKPSPRAQQHYACEPRHCTMKVDSGATWPCRQAGLQQQIGGQCHCCPDFFSFWKLKLVRLFSFLCF